MLPAGPGAGAACLDSSALRGAPPENEDGPRVAVSLGDIESRCRQAVSCPDFYRRLAESGLELGPDFQRVERF